MEEEEEAGQGLVRPGCGVLPGLQVLVGVHQEGRKEGKGGPAPFPIWIGLGGGSPSLAPFPSFPLRPNKAHIPTGGFR